MRFRRWPISIVVSLLLLLGLTAPVEAGSPVVAAVGDIGCPAPFVPEGAQQLMSDSGEPTTPQACQQAGTSRLVAEGGDYSAVLALGDLLAPRTTLNDFQRSYEPTWGQFKDITLPVVGNHEYAGDGARGYFDYFNGPGARTGRAGKTRLGWHRTRLGRWLVLGLNSNCRRVACSGRSRQAMWLRRTIRKDRRSRQPSSCILAFWHHPRFSSGRHGNTYDIGAFWRILRNRRADVVLNGHDHLYERFVPLSPSGAPDPGGITQFTVGKGGRSLFSFVGEPHPGSDARIAGRFGILRLRLLANGFRWLFLATDGQVLDSGKSSCNPKR